MAVRSTRCSVADKYWKEVGSQMTPQGQVIQTFERDLPDGLLILVVTSGSTNSQTMIYIPYEPRVTHGDTRF